MTVCVKSYKIGTALDSIKDYLSERTHIVKMDNILSDTCKVQTGVPQGTIFGPSFLYFI